MTTTIQCSYETRLNEFSTIQLGENDKRIFQKLLKKWKFTWFKDRNINENFPINTKKPFWDGLECYTIYGKAYTFDY